VWYEGNPCNMHLMDLSAAVKEGVEAAGMVGMRFNTIGVSDGISMGTDGMSYSLQSRDIIADSIETVHSSPPSFQRERESGAVLRQLVGTGPAGESVSTLADPSISQRASGVRLTETGEPRRACEREKMEPLLSVEARRWLHQPPWTRCMDRRASLREGFWRLCPQRPSPAHGRACDEQVMCAQWYDANISLPGCDKNMPGTLMAMARVNRPSLMVYGGTIKPGHSSTGATLDIVSAFQSYGAPPPERRVDGAAPVIAQRQTAAAKGTPRGYAQLRASVQAPLSWAVAKPWARQVVRGLPTPTRRTD
jgi:hypothetical protein